MTLRRFALVPTLLAAFALAAAASPIPWAFTGSLGAASTVTGQMDFDSTNNSVTSFSFSFGNQGGGISPFDQNGTSYTMDNEDAVLSATHNYGPVYSGGDLIVEVFETDNGSGTGPDHGAGNAFLSLSFVVDSNGNIVNFILSDQTYGSNFSQKYSFGFTSGQISQVAPEPPSWMLSLTGALLLLAGFTWHERRRSPSAAL